MAYQFFYVRFLRPGGRPGRPVVYICFLSFFTTFVWGRIVEHFEAKPWFSIGNQRETIDFGLQAGPSFYVRYASFFRYPTVYETLFYLGNKNRFR